MSQDKLKKKLRIDFSRLLGTEFDGESILLLLRLIVEIFRPNMLKNGFYLNFSKSRQQDRRLTGQNLRNHLFRLKTNNFAAPMLYQMLMDININWVKRGGTKVYLYRNVWGKKSLSYPNIITIPENKCNSLLLL